MNSDSLLQSVKGFLKRLYAFLFLDEPHGSAATDAEAADPSAPDRREPHATHASQTPAEGHHDAQRQRHGDAEDTRPHGPQEKEGDAHASGTRTMHREDRRAQSSAAAPAQDRAHADASHPGARDEETLDILQRAPTHTAPQAQAGIPQRPTQERRDISTPSDSDISSAAPQHPAMRGQAHPGVPQHISTQPKTPRQRTGADATSRPQAQTQHPRTPHVPPRTASVPDRKPAGGEEVPDLQERAIERMLKEIEQGRLIPQGRPKPRMRKEVSPFRLHGGGTLTDLADLRAEAAVMEPETFSHHVTQDRNDFADWIRHEFGDAELSEAVRRARTPRQLWQILVSHAREKRLPRLGTDDDGSVTEAQRIEIEHLRAELEELRRSLGDELASGLRSMREERESFEQLKRELQQHRVAVADVQKRLEQKKHELHAASEAVRMQQDQLAQSRRDLEHVQELTRQKRSEAADDAAQLIERQIAAARELLEQRAFTDAKHLYAAIRERFYHSDLSDEQRGALYPRIRELYTDVERATQTGAGR